METLKQIRVAVVGMPDAGKSTFIKAVLEHVIGKHLQPDTLMREVHWSDGRDPYGNPDTRTIKCAKILFKYKGVEICMYDCPGHLEYEEQIIQGIFGAHCILKIIDDKREHESISYFKQLRPLDKPTYTLYSHSEHNTYPYYDVDKENFKDVAIQLLDMIVANYFNVAVDIEEEALTIIRNTITPSTNNIMFFSGGKDSVVGLDLLKRADVLGNVKVFYPQSGYDFKEVEEVIKYYEEFYKIQITPFDNSLHRTYEQNTPFEMMSAKAEANNLLIDSLNAQIVCVQYRASDEGVRSKDYHISDKGTHKRFSPVFYFSETNIWRYISKHNIHVCNLYFKGYRSLGDEPVTLPCMPEMTCVEDIVKYIDSHTETTERDGRIKQDNSEKFAMEKLRDNGFF